MSLNLILLGLPGAGKGTQAQFIVDKYHVPHISTGDMFREAISNGTPLGLKAKGFTDNGNLVPDEVTNGIVKERLDKDDTKPGFLLDGYPRTLDQADALSNMTDELSKPLSAVINIDVDPKLLTERLSGRFICKKCGATYHKLYHMPKVPGTCDVCGSHEFYQREDDKPEAVKNRLKVNVKMNTPLISYYQDRNLLFNVDGSKGIDDVWKNVDNILSSL
ncbi:MAG: adenylate kinase [Lactobacillus sp.]|jgi:adenylate kinase|uniref:Adenylate kinase n=2 Tax=Lentilactobacillus diolivorans TaxID=179838 RepID=A0A0R1S8M2_9LACO|nr:adenylate kinase [Lentilactobacillus diolivorans DSM 14421]RRG01563.1 MAG: adenylate kinase [Lactobacillus sp.]GEP24294.1 adenylate kinase [Lentilactobacillus diolivorans]